MTNRLLTLALASTLSLLAGCGDDATQAPAPASPGAPAGGQMQPAAPSQDLVQTATGAGKFKTLAQLLTQAELVATLQGTGPFTVFAPTDEAFAKLPPALVADLTRPENKAKLQAVLTYHVVAGKVAAADVVKLTSARTVQGTDVRIQVKDGKVLLDGAATVIQADVSASNGVIHVIDTVLVPAS